MSKFNIPSAAEGGASAGVPTPGISEAAAALQWSFSKNGWYELLGLDKLVAQAAGLADKLGENTLHMLLISLCVCLFLLTVSKVFGFFKWKRLEYIRRQKYGHGE